MDTSGKIRKEKKNNLSSSFFIIHGGKLQPRSGSQRLHDLSQVFHCAFYTNKRETT